MATGDYCSLDEVKERLWPDGATQDSLNDSELANTITAASRAIDEYTGTRFYSTAADETRYYSAEDQSVLWPNDDILTITTLTTDDDGTRTYGTTWATTDYDALPLNYSLTARPIRWLEVTPNGNYYFPLEKKAIKIVGKFGYATAAPALVKEAAILLVIRWHKRPDSPFGVAGVNAFGTLQTIPADDPDMQKMLNPFRRLV